VLQRAGLSSLPRANVAVLVGTALDPVKSRRPATLPGVTINTLWGEMAAQIAESAGKPALYDFVKEADKKGVSPGSGTLKALFNAASPCVILIDELVAYARNIYGKTNLPAGTFDTLMTFVQSLTEAAKASRNSLVVASIPESDIESGGDIGKIALHTIEHTFGRMESIWKPVSATEGFEVVRRRLFLDCKNPGGRDTVCAAFSHFYGENTSDFPRESKELEYKNRMVSCYPIHPEVFDRLYEDWATLERFQRTRGVLRLMAAVIHELWMGADASLLIMPGSIPLDAPNVRYELLRNLDNNELWSPIVDREVDGKNSVPYQKDQSNPRYGVNLAARRIARTIMLGNAPNVGSRVRGIEASRVRLGVIQPGKTSPISTTPSLRLKAPSPICTQTPPATVSGTTHAPRSVKPWKTALRRLPPLMWSTKSKTACARCGKSRSLPVCTSVPPLRSMCRTSKTPALLCCVPPTNTKPVP